MEGVFEEDSQLRRCVEHELLSETNISPEQALKVYRHIHNKWRKYQDYCYFIASVQYHLVQDISQYRTQ